MNELLDVRKLFDHVSEIWILTDKTGKVLLSSRYLEKFQHLITPPLQAGSSLFNSIPDSWRSLAKNVLDTLPGLETPAILEANVPDATGKESHFEIRCTAIKSDAGELQYVFVEAADVTRQKIFEKKITIVAREYQSVIENANAVIIGTDARGYITEWNEMATQVTGFSKNESYIRKLTDFLVMESPESFSMAVSSVLHGKVITNYEMIVQSRDERRLTLLINATPRRSASGEVVGVLLIGQDITELSDYKKSLEQKVLERTRALKSALENEKKLVEVKDRFVSMASHEFRSPISYIHRNLGAVAEHLESLSTEEVRHRLSKIQSQAEHLTSLLEDVLTIGKTGATNTRIKANLSTVDLGDFLQRVIDEVKSNTLQTHRVDLDFPFSSLTILSDEMLLRNIFVNLLTNAIKFSPGREVVEVRVEKQDQFVQLSVRDFGLGINEEDLPKIFDPFHRGGNVREIKGTGLGLAIVKKAVETLEGEVTVESAPGQGTLFTVRLNLYQ